MNDKNFAKINVKVMYPCTKFQLNWKNSDFGTTISQKIRINIKFETRIKQFMSVTDFIQFGELQFLGPNLPKNHFRVEYLDKCMQPENNLL